MVDEMGELYEPGLPAGSSASPSELSPPGGGFVVLAEDGRALAGGGVKRLDERACEIKRMYVVPGGARPRRRPRAARGAGGRSRATSATRSRGSTRARSSRGAQRMYERAGYAPIPDYNGNPYASFWGEKRL